ncbi:MAG: hypothetical protein IJ301_03680 [Clostridia bacterium]|nr:hypothetical protein [Clostridia bacterium]
MKVETIKIQKMIATEEEKQKLKNGLEVLNTIDNNTYGSDGCVRCPLAKMCDTTTCQVGCLIHFSQKVFTKLIDNL